MEYALVHAFPPPFIFPTMHTRFALHCLLFFWIVPGLVAAAEPGPVPGWPGEVREEWFPSRADGTMQPTLFYRPPGDAPAPLLVALHTWKGTHLQADPGYAAWCIRKGWVLVHPNFRGPNNTPEACGSERVVEDILSVVDWARERAKVDPRRIYLVGCSGGGYASMLLAGRAPQLWAGVSQWCGIYDLGQWHAERSADGYGRMLEAVCGGAPGDSPAVDEQYRRRSASTWFQAAAGIPMDLNTGIFDGHKASVPVSHSLRAFNTLARPVDRFSEEQVRELTATPAVPQGLRFDGEDPLYGNLKVLLRRVSGQARITVFEGGHQSIVEAGLAWLEQQVKGQPAVWKIEGAASRSGAAEVGK
jgi:pimeloyl-ACP methyl ester carboxylesterase